MSRLKRLLNLAGWGIALGFLALAWQRIFAGPGGWSHVFAGLDWRLLAPALAALLAGQGLLGLSGYVGHRSLGRCLSPGRSYRYWFVSQLTKYIPGGVWQVAARVVLYRRDGLPTAVAGALTVWELAALLLTSLLLSLTGGVWASPELAALVAVCAALILGLLLLSQHDRFWRALRRLGWRGAETMLDAHRRVGGAPMRVYLSLGALYVLAWLLIGTGFYWLALAVPDVLGLPWWQAVTSFTAAWAVGFLVIIAPVGIGPREAVLTILLAPRFGVTIAFSIAIVARLWWTLGEALHLGAALPWYWTQRTHHAAAEPSPSVGRDTGL